MNNYKEEVNVHVEEKAETPPEMPENPLNNLDV